VFFFRNVIMHINVGILVFHCVNGKLFISAYSAQVFSSIELQLCSKSVMKFLSPILQYLSIHVTCQRRVYSDWLTIFYFVAIVSLSAAMVTKLILSRKKLEVLFLCYLYLTFPFLYIWNYGS
jgi:hypothetical protein